MVGRQHEPFRRALVDDPGEHRLARTRVLPALTLSLNSPEELTLDILLYLIVLIWDFTEFLIQPLPTQTPPSTSPTSGDWIGLIEGYIKDGATLMGLAISTIGFLWVSYIGFAKFNEARQGRAEWAEVGVFAIVGAVVLIFASYLLTEAAGII